jgi:hypothetical protein
VSIDTAEGPVPYFAVYSASIRFWAEASVLLGESLSDNHPARGWFRDRYPLFRANLAAALRAGVDVGEIRPEPDCPIIRIIPRSTCGQPSVLTTDRAGGSDAPGAAAMGLLRGRAAYPGSRVAQAV